MEIISLPTKDNVERGNLVNGEWVSSTSGGALGYDFTPDAINVCFYGFYIETVLVYPFEHDAEENFGYACNLTIKDIFGNVSTKQIIPYSWTILEIGNIACMSIQMGDGREYSKSECYDENDEPMSGRKYIRSRNFKAWYSQWIERTDRIETINMISPADGIKTPLPHSIWRLEDGSITISRFPEAATPLHEPLPYSLWRLTSDERDYIFHRRLPDHRPPEPVPPEPDEPFDDIPTLEYDVYCDGKPLHIAQSPLEGYRVLDGVLTLNDSAAGAFEFTIGAFHSLYNSILMMASTITVNLNGEEIWEGRPVSFKENLWKDHVVTCEGELAYLNDIFLPPMVYTNTTPDVILRNIIDGSDRTNEPISDYAYNAKCSENRKIYVGSVPTPDASKYSVDVDKYVVNYDTVLNVVLDICKKYGYHVYVEKRIVDGVKKRYLVFLGDDGYGENASQKIIFGRNLVDYSKSYNFANIVTALLPLGAKISSDKKVVIDDTQAGWLTPDDTINDRVIERYTYYVDRTKYQVVRAASSNESPALQYPAYYSVKVLDLYERNYNYIYVTTNMKGPTTFDNGAKREPALFAIYVPDGQDGGTFYDAKFTKGTAQEGTVLNKHKIDVTPYQTMQGAQLCIGLYDDGTFNSFEIRKSKTSDETTEEYITIRDVSGAYSPTTGDDVNALYAISTAEDEEHKTPIQRYGRIEKKVEWSEVKDSSTLYNNAKAYLDSDQFDGLQIELTAMDMKMFDINVNRLRVGEYVRCVAPPYGLDKLMPIRSLKIPILKPEDAKYTVGDSRQSTLTSNSSASNDELARLIGEKPTMGSVLVAAKQSAYDSLVNSTQNSYVTFVYDTSDKIREIIICNGTNYTDANAKYWVLNSSGIGYVDNATQRTEVAMMMDGSINANMITTGVMSADYIRGGTLKLGDWVVDPGGGAPTYKVGGKFWVYGSQGQTAISAYPLIRVGRDIQGQDYPDYSYGLEITEPKTGIDVNNDHTYGHYISIKDGRIFFTGHGPDGEPKSGTWCQIAITNYAIPGIDYWNTLAISAPALITLESNYIGIPVNGQINLTHTGSVTCGGKSFTFDRGFLMSVTDTSSTSGSFTTADGKTVTVTNGVITNITTPSNNNNE